MNKFFPFVLTVFFSLFLCLWTTGRAMAEEAAPSGEVSSLPATGPGAPPEIKLASLNLIYEKTAGEEEEGKDSSPLADQKTYNISGGFRQIFGFIESADRISQLFVTGSARLQKSWVASFSQQLSFHYLNKEPGKYDHWQLEDSLFYIKRTDKLPYKSSVNTSASLSLPLSDSSRRNNKWTEATASVSGNLQLDAWLKKAGDFKPSWLKNIALFAEGVGRYYLFEKTTTPTIGQSAGGRPLPQYLFGLRQTGLRFNITDYVSLTGLAGGWMISPYKTYARDAHSSYLGLGDFPRIYYMFSFSSAFKWKQWTASASYSQLDRLDKLGRKQVFMFDDQRSTWSLSLSYAFSFDRL